MDAETLAATAAVNNSPRNADGRVRPSWVRPMPAYSTSTSIFPLPGESTFG